MYSLDVSLGGVLVTDAAANAVFRIGPRGIERTWILPPVHETITADVLAGLNAQSPPDQQAPDCLDRHRVGQRARPHLGRDRA